MNQQKIIDAYAAVHELTGTVLPYRAARGIASLKRALTEEMEAIIDWETALAKEHGGTAQGDGRFSFETPEQNQAFLEALKAGREQDDPEIRLPSVDLSRCVGNLRITPKAVEALDGLVIFEEENADG